MRIRKRSSWDSGNGYVSVMFDGNSVWRSLEKGTGNGCVFSIHRNLRIIHCFEQRGLRARRSAIDLIGQNDVGKKSDRSEIQIRVSADCKR